MSPSQVTTIQTRANWIYQVLDSAMLLWVYDNPIKNNNISQIFHSLRISVRYARSNDEAMREITDRKFDVIISDVGRGGEKSGGHLTICPVRWFERPTDVRDDEDYNTRPDPGFYLGERIQTDVALPESHRAPIIYYTKDHRAVSKCSSLVTGNSFDLINEVFDLLERRRWSRFQRFLPPGDDSKPSQPKHETRGNSVIAPP